MYHLLDIWMFEKYLTWNVKNEASPIPCLLHNNSHGHVHANEWKFILTWVMPQSINKSCLQKTFRIKLLQCSLPTKLPPRPAPHWPPYLHPRPITVCFLTAARVIPCQSWTYTSKWFFSGNHVQSFMMTCRCPPTPDLNAISWDSSSYVLCSTHWPLNHDRNNVPCLRTLALACFQLPTRHISSPPCSLSSNMKAVSVHGIDEEGQDKGWPSHEDG